MKSWKCDHCGEHVEDGKQCYPKHNQVTGVTHVLCICCLEIWARKWFSWWMMMEESRKELLRGD